MFYKPEHERFYSPSLLGFVSEDFSFTSADGETIKGLKILSKQSPVKGQFVYFQNYQKNMNHDFKEIAWLSEHGYDVILFDYRGYGESSENPSPWKTHQEALGLFQYLENHIEGKLIIYCQGLGGIICMRAIPEWQNNDQADLVILDSSFLSYIELVRYKMKQSWWTRWFTFVLTYEFDETYSAKGWVSKIPSLIFLIHGEDDKVVPLQFGEEIYENIKNKTSFWKIQNSGHAETFKNKERRFYFHQEMERILNQKTE
ncbi:MAG: alpha/beta hydrolase [Bacteriovoracaceae bacterium]